MQTLTITTKGNYRLIEIDNGKVNAINTQLVRDLDSTFKSLEEDKTVKGAILTGRPNCFSAGLDIVSLAVGGEPEGRLFWDAYFSACQRMIRFSKPLVCAITGYAQAGATILSLCTDYRIMAKGEKHKIGMNEFNMSLQIPELLCDIFAYHMGEKQAWEAVQTATLYTSDEAVEVGLVNESMEMEDVLPAAEKYLKKLMYVTPKVYADSKKYLRKGLLHLVDRDMKPLIEDIIQQSSTPEMEQMLKMFIQSIKKDKV